LQPRRFGGGAGRSESGGADAIVVGGDVVPGAFAGEALVRLEALGASVHWVRANGERETAAALSGPPPTEGADAAEMAAFTARLLEFSGFARAGNPTASGTPNWPKF
jgi:hypothetical protein